MVNNDHSGIGEVRQYIENHLLPIGISNDDLSPGEIHIFELLIVARKNIMNKIEHDALLLMELYICCHGEGKPQLSFVSNWLYRGLLEYHSSRGECDGLERLLGLKLNKRHTPFTKHSIKSRHYDLAFKIHFLRVIGGLSVTTAINKIIGIETCAMDFQSLKDIYYKQKDQFDAWKELLTERYEFDESKKKEELALWGL